MRIYHYTSLESLALILQNKTIRFNRLDKVDDLEEGNVESLGIKFCKYIFVSCWTEDENENIPLWKMYGGDLGGVRISMEKEMFKMYDISNLIESKKTLYSKIPFHDYANPNYFVIPHLEYTDDMFYRHIKYVDDISFYTKNAIQLTDIKNNFGHMNIDMKSFGYYKNKRWEFQKEVRFVLYILPFNILLERKNPELGTIVMQCLLQNKTLPFHFYDMHLNEEAVNSMEITLSPSITEAQRVIVEALKDKYAPQAKILDSTLGKIVRLK